MSTTLEKDILEMMEAAMHFGHQTHRWNPKMRRFIYGNKNGIHIFDLHKTKICIDEAMEFIKHSMANGKNIMLVSTKPQAADLIMQSAKQINMPYVINKWIPGLLTNFSTIKKRIGYFNKLEQEEKNGDFSKYTKKEASKMKKELVKLSDAFGGVKEIDKLPGMVFVADVVRDKIVVKEAKKKGIKIIAITDTNADPSDIDFPIPANDDAFSSLVYVVEKIKSAVKEAQGEKQQ